MKRCPIAAKIAGSIGIHVGLFPCWKKKRVSALELGGRTGGRLWADTMGTMVTHKVSLCFRVPHKRNSKEKG